MRINIAQILAATALLATFLGLWRWLVAATPSDLFSVEGIAWVAAGVIWQFALVFWIFWVFFDEPTER